MKIRAVPTFVIGGRVLTGLYDAATLEWVIEEELSRRSGETLGGLRPVIWTDVTETPQTRGFFFSFLLSRWKDMMMTGSSTLEVL